MTTAQYKFERASGMSGFLTKNRPSTDALNALGEWQELDPGREIATVVDEDDMLVAELSWRAGDDSAAQDLDKACQNHGVARSHVES
jgi:hypothetical protein